MLFLLGLLPRSSITYRAVRFRPATSICGSPGWLDNVFIERLWRSVKHEEVYLKAYENLTEARRELGAYFDFYNRRRRHQGLADRTPDEVYWSTLRTQATAA